MLQLQNIQKTYKVKKKMIHALNGIDYTFSDHGFYWISGASGSGKSTLLHIIGGLEKASSGTVSGTYSFDQIGIVFQDHNLLSDFTVYDNLAIFGSSKEDIEKTLSQLDLLDRMNVQAKYLSGGEKQRLGIARALLKNVQILLLDEPTGNLDEENTVIIFKLLQQLSEYLLVIMVSHNELAKEYATWQLILSEGKLVETIKLKEEKKKKDRFVRQTKKKAFGFIFQLRYAFQLALKRPLLSILEVILITLCLFSYLTLSNYTGYDKAETLYRSLETKEIVHQPMNLQVYMAGKNDKKVAIGDRLYQQLQQIYGVVFPYIWAQVNGQRIKIYLDESLSEEGLVLTDYIRDVYLLPYQTKQLDLTLFSDAFRFNTTMSVLSFLNTDYSTFFGSNIGNNEFTNTYRDLIENKYLIGYLNPSVFQSLLVNENAVLSLKGTTFNPTFYQNRPLTDFYFKVDAKYQMAVEELSLIKGQMPKNKYDLVVTYDLEVGSYNCFDFTDSNQQVYYGDIFELSRITPNVFICGVAENLSNTGADTYISKAFYEEIVKQAYSYLVSGFSVDTTDLNQQALQTAITKSLLADCVFELDMYASLDQYQNLTNFMVSILEPFSLVFLVCVFLFTVYVNLKRMNSKEKERMIFKSYGIGNVRFLCLLILYEEIKIVFSFLLAVLISAGTIFLLDRQIHVGYRNFSFLIFRYDRAFLILGAAVLLGMISLLLTLIRSNSRTITFNLKNNR